MPLDLLRHLPTNATYHTIISSNLWDLSLQCNKEVNVSAESQEIYRQGTILLHESLQKILPASTSFYWRTSPPVSQNYSEANMKPGMARNRPNQRALNEVMRESVRKNNLHKPGDTSMNHHSHFESGGVNGCVCRLLPLVYHRRNIIKWPAKSIHSRINISSVTG